MKHLLRRLLILSIVSSIIFTGLIVALIKFYGEPFAKDYIEKGLAGQLGLKIKIEELKIVFIPPFSLKLQKIDVMTIGEKGQVQVDSAEVFIDLFKTLPNLPDLNLFARARVVKPVITVRLPFLPAKEVALPSGKITPEGGINVNLPANFNLNLEVDLQEGQFEVLRQNEAKQYSSILRADKLFANLKIPTLDGEWDFAVFTKIVSDKISQAGAPLEIKAKLGMDLAPLILKVTSSELHLGGIPGSITGFINPGTSQYSLDTKINVPDLGKIRSFAFPGTWQGALLAEVKIENKGKFQSTGNIELKNVYGDLEHVDDGVKLSGSVGINSTASFSFSDSFKMDSVNFAANFTNMALTYKEFFKKDRAIPLTFVGSLSKDESTLKINQMNFVLGTLRGSLSGHFGVQNVDDSFFKIAIVKTALTGLEAFFPIIRSPLTGVAEVNLEVRGAPSKPESLFIDVNPLILSNVRIDTTWKSKDETKNIQGAITINTRSNFRIQNQELKSSTTDTQIDFGKIGIIWGDTFIKPLGNNLRLDLVANQKDFVTQIHKAELNTAAGVINITGTLKDPLKPDMDLKIHTPEIDLTRLTMMLPVLSKWKLSGKFNGETRLVGRYDPALGLETSPLRMNGFVKAYLPEFAYIPETPQDGKPVVADAPVPGKKVPSILPPWPILLNSTFRSELVIGKLFYKDIIVDGIKWTGNLDKGTLAGQMDLKEFFGGTVTVGRIRVPLKEAMPMTQVNAVWGNLDGGKAFDWFLPTWKGQFTGTSNGSIDLVLLHPQNPDFLKESLVRGKLTLKNAFLSSLKFDQVVNEKINKIPGLGTNAQLSTKGVAATINTDFEYNKEMLRFRSLNILTPENNEFSAVGWIRTDRTMDIKGDVSLSNPPVEGSVVKANSDKKGRLVVPVQLEGKISEPKLNIADQTIKMMMSKTAEYEGHRLRGEAQRALNMEVDKTKKKVGDELSQGLKNLFGK